MRFARRAKENKNAEMAKKYYEMIALERPFDWEAEFYFNYFSAQNITLKDLANAVTLLGNSIPNTFSLLAESNQSPEEKWVAAKEIITSIDSLCDRYIRWTKSHYREFSSVKGSIIDLDRRANAIAELQLAMADSLEKYFVNEAGDYIVRYLKSYINNYLLKDIVARTFVSTTIKYNGEELKKAEVRIKVLEPNYVSEIESICTPVSLPQSKPTITPPKGAKILFHMAWISPLVFLFFFLAFFGDSLGDTDALILMFFTGLCGLPILFAVIGKAVCCSALKKHQSENPDKDGK